MSQTYSFLDVTASLVGPGGVISLGSGSGTADEGITIDPTGDIGGMLVGADGSGQHSLYADKSGRVTLRVLKTSPVNAQLMAMYNFQTATASSYGQNTLVIADTNRVDLVSCRQVAFAKVPTLTYAKEAGVNEWVFNAVTIDRTLGT